MKLLDIREIIQKNPKVPTSYRDVNDIKYLAIHHSLTKTGSAEAFAEYHIGTKGWSRMSYTYVILRDGTIQWAADWNVRTPHVGNSSRVCLGICMVGDFRYQEPTDSQYKSLYELTEYLQKELSIPTENIRGHQELPDYSWKQCPSLDMDALRGNIKARVYKPVKNNFNNDQKIEIKIPKESEVLQLEGYQWNMLEDILQEFHAKGILDSEQWYQKASNKELTQSELAFLNTVLIKRNLFGK